jgi:phosphatidylserine/phosphatidylglycerophosphate/cardiolipin synthase-like enzyme
MKEVLGALGIFTGNPQQTRLVTPYADGIKAFSTFLGTAKTKMRAMIYGATLPIFFDDLIAAKQRGIDVKVIFDHTQSAGPAEHVQIERLITAGWVDGVDFVIGTSPEAGQIIHIKATWIDDLHVEDGSLNYSPSGFKQINTVTFTESAEWAAYLENIFNTAWEWITVNDQRFQLKDA